MSEPRPFGERPMYTDDDWRVPRVIDETAGSRPMDTSQVRDETRLPAPDVFDAPTATDPGRKLKVTDGNGVFVPSPIIPRGDLIDVRTDQRPSLDQTFMDIAWLWAARGTCNRAQVGAVLARNGHQLMAGYNGAPKGMPHCDHTDDEACTTAVHDAANLIGHAARIGVAVDGSTFYSTHSPCVSCALLLISAGIVRVVYAWPYRIDTTELLRSAEVHVEQFGRTRA